MSLNNTLLLVIAILLLIVVILQFFTYRLKRKEAAEGGNKYKSNTASAIRDVLIASMTKGQLPIAILGIIGIIVFIRLPSETLLTVIAKFPQVFKTLGSFGWILLLFVCLFSIASVHKLKTLNAKERTDFEKDRQGYLKMINELNNTIKKLSEPTKTKK